MNRILREMKKRIEPLLTLICKANKRIKEAEENGYEIDISCWGSTGWRPSIKEVILTKFSKDLIKSDGEVMTPDAIKDIFEQITQELKELQKEYYCIEVTGRRPNGVRKLYLEKVYMVLTPDDYRQLFYE